MKTFENGSLVIGEQESSQVLILDWGQKCSMLTDNLPMGTAPVLIIYGMILNVPFEIGYCVVINLSLKQLYLLNILGKVEEFDPNPAATNKCGKGNWKEKIKPLQGIHVYSI